MNLYTDMICMHAFIALNPNINIIRTVIILFKRGYNPSERRGTAAKNLGQSGVTTCRLYCTHALRAAHEHLINGAPNHECLESMRVLDCIMGRDQQHAYTIYNSTFFV